MLIDTKTRPGKLGVRGIGLVLGVSAIMTTAVVGVLPSTGVTVGLVCLGVTTVGAALMALISLLPSTGAKKRPPNPLFFADAARMPYEDFRRLMGDVIESPSAIYEAIVIDLHESATVLLDHKYRFLRLGYIVFIVGLTATVGGVIVDVAIGNI